MADRRPRSVDYSELWHKLRGQVLEMYETSRNVCVTESNFGNIMRAQGMVTGIGSVIGAMESMWNEARGIDPDAQSDDEPVGHA